MIRDIQELEVTENDLKNQAPLKRVKRNSRIDCPVERQATQDRMKKKKLQHSQVCAITSQTSRSALREKVEFPGL